MRMLLINLTIAVTCLTATSLRADDTELLTGKWSVKKSYDDQSVTQTIEIKKDKFVFELRNSDNQLTIHAEGDFKVEKLGPFKAARFSHIRGGDSASNLDDIDDEYASIYVLDGDDWTVAANFDKQRDQKPSLDVYHRMPAPAGSLVIDEIQMADTPQSGTWFLCFEATVQGATRQHYIEGKGFERNQVTIPIALELPKVKAGQKCTFKLQLDDVDGDACGDEPDNRSTGDFTISERGSQSFKPESNWRYTVRWHLK